MQVRHSATVAILKNRSSGMVCGEIAIFLGILWQKPEHLK